MTAFKTWEAFNEWRHPAIRGKYEKADIAEAGVSLLNGAEHFESRPEQKDRTQHLRTLRCLTVINVLILSAYVVVAYFHLRTSQRPGPARDASSAIRQTSYYSPILNSMDFTLHDVQLNGTLWPPKTPSWMREEHYQPRIEAICEPFEPGFEYSFAITREDVLGLGKDPDLAVTLPRESGPNKYIASFGSLHKTHCLNELRKMTFEDYGAAVVEKHKHGKFWWVHLRHCVDMLMQDQLCHADTDMIIYNWVDTQKYPWPDMSINRRCRSWDQLMEWGREHVVDRESMEGLVKPEGVVELPFERGYYEMFGFDDSKLFPNGTGYEW